MDHPTKLLVDTPSSIRGISRTSYDPHFWFRIYGISPFFPGLSPSFGRSSLPHGISPVHPSSIPPSWSLPPRRARDPFLLPPSLSVSDQGLIENREQDGMTPIPSNRFGKATQFLRSAFRQLPHRRVEQAKSPITIRLDENRTRLEELSFVTATKRLNQRGTCTLDLSYTNDNGINCLTFYVKALAASETGARFRLVALSVRLLDPGKCLNFRGYRVDKPNL